MKKNHYHFLYPLFIFIATIFFITCTKDKPSQIDKKAKSKSTCSSCQSAAIWIPEGTILTEDKNSLLIKTPGYTYIGHDSKDKILPLQVSGAGDRVTCTCLKHNCSGDNEYCSPVTYPDGHGSTVLVCRMSGCCSECERKYEKLGNDGAHGSIGSAVLIQTGGYVNLLLEVSLYEKQDVETPYGFEAMASYPEIYEQMENFIYKITGEEYSYVKPIEKEDGLLYAPDGYVFVILNVFGRAVVTLLPAKVLVDIPDDQMFEKMSCPLENKQPQNAKYFFYLPQQDSKGEILPLYLYRERGYAILNIYHN